MFRPALPKVPRGEKAKAAVLNQRSGVGSSSLGSPTTSGRSFAPKPRFAAARVAVVDVGQERDREGPPRLQGDDAVSLPARERCRQPAAVVEEPAPLAERQVVGVADGEAVAHVEVRAATLGPHVEAVLREVRVARAREKARGVVNGLGPGVGREHGEPAREALLEARLQTVVAGVGARLQNVDVVELGHGPEDEAGRVRHAAG